VWQKKVFVGGLGHKNEEKQKARVEKSELRNGVEPGRGRWGEKRKTGFWEPLAGLTQKKKKSVKPSLPSQRGPAQLRKGGLGQRDFWWGGGR